MKNKADIGLIKGKSEKLYGKKWQKKLAKEIGVSPSLISLLMNRRRKRIGLVSSRKLSKVLNIPLDSLGYETVMINGKKIVVPESEAIILEL